MLFPHERLELNSPIKWAGGKRFIIEKIEHLIDANNNKKCFVELFAGSLAISLEYQPKKLIVNDRNWPLINMWKTIKNYPDELCNLLEIYSNDKIYNNKTKFNQIKDEFNILKMDENLSEEQMIKLATQFIYLNKRSFNGLYRENQSGLYNVPYRHYKNSELYDKNNIKSISKYFNENDVSFFCGTYSDIEIPKDSLIYLDPPYYPSDTSNFTAYTKHGFSINNQKELLNYCNQLNKKKINFIQSNSPCEEIMELYCNYNMEEFYIHRSMRSAKEGIKKKDEEPNEILIWN